jgi:hypothetical protein
MDASITSTASHAHPATFERTSVAPVAPVTTASTSAPAAALKHTSKQRDTAEAERRLRYGDEKVANRDTKVWHGATDSGP